MTPFLSFRPHPLLLPPTTERSMTTSSNPLLLNRNNLPFSNHKPFTRSSVGVVRFGLKPPFLDSDAADGMIQHMFGRVEGLLYTIADAAVVAASESTNGAKQNGDWLSGITNLMETVLKVLKDGISTVHAPYAYGFAIILLTVIVKAATFPLSKKQVESAMAMRNLQPQVKAIQQQYAGDKEKIQMETARLYKLAGVNPLAGCLPTLATIPVWIGLYRALSNVADEGLLTEGFFWIPTLSGPTTIASRQNGNGISWLFPFVDGHPPLGWSDTLAYLVLPVLLVVSQYVSLQITQSSQSNDPSMKSSQVITKFLPLMIGYFALSVPSGLSLYWFTNNILSTAQMVWLQKLGGANVTVRQFIDDTVVEEKPEIQKSVLDVKTTTSTDSRQGEKTSSEGLRPGERFKMLKEQEARRKQQREEEKKKAEEAVNQTAVTNEEHNEEEKKKAEEAVNQTAVTNEEHNEEEKKKAEEAVNQTAVTNEEHNEEEKSVITKDEVNEPELVNGEDDRLQSVTTEHNYSKVGVTSVNGGHSAQESKNNQEQVSSSSEDLKKEEVEIYTTTTDASAVVSENDAHQKNSTTEQKR